MISHGYERFATCSMLWILTIVLLRVYAQSPEMMEAAVGRKRTRLAKSEPYLKCDVCRLTAEKMWTLFEEARNTTHASKLGEVELGELVEPVCDTDDDNG